MGATFSSDSLAKDLALDPEVRAVALARPDAAPVLHPNGGAVLCCDPMTFDLEIAAQASLTREDIGALVRPVDLPEELLRGQIDARASAQRVGGGAVGAAPAAEAALCPSCAGSGRSQQACPDIMSGASGNLRFSKTGTFIGRTSSSSRKGVPRKATWLVARDGGWECFSEHMMDLLEEAWDDGVGAKISIQLPDRAIFIDLDNMIQTEAATLTKLSIKRIPITKPAAAASWEAVRPLKALQRNYSEESLAGFVPVADGDADNSVDEEFFDVDESLVPGTWLARAHGKPETSSWWSGESSGGRGSGWFILQPVSNRTLEQAWLLEPGCSVNVGVDATGRNCGLEIWECDLTAGTAVVGVAFKRVKTYDILRIISPPISEAKLSLKGHLDDKQDGLEEDQCWVCNGGGFVSSWLSGFEVPSKKGREGDDSDDNYRDCLICYSEGKFGLSTECDHYFCEECILLTLDAILATGQFPAFCPCCRAETAPKAPKQGRIMKPALAFLKQRDLIDAEFYFRFGTAMDRADDREVLEWFECPGPARDLRGAARPGDGGAARSGICGAFLAKNKKGTLRYQEISDSVFSFSLGRCPDCWARICMVCMKVETAAVHLCEKVSNVFEQDKIKARNEKAEAATMAALGSITKPCPLCGKRIQKSDGCDWMTCGTNAHGKLKDALRNGGCGCAFTFSDCKLGDDLCGWWDLDGKKKRGRPVTARMYREGNHPGCNAAGCNYFASTDGVEFVSPWGMKDRGSGRWKASHAPSGGGKKFCCDGCRQGRQSHSKLCHRLTKKAVGATEDSGDDGTNPFGGDNDDLRQLFGNMDAPGKILQLSSPFICERVRVAWDSSYLGPGRPAQRSFFSCCSRKADDEWLKRDGTPLHFEFRGFSAAEADGLDSASFEALSQRVQSQIRNGTGRIRTEQQKQQSQGFFASLTSWVKKKESSFFSVEPKQALPVRVEKVEWMPVKHPEKAEQSSDEWWHPFQKHPFKNKPPNDASQIRFGGAGLPFIVAEVDARQQLFDEQGLHLEFRLREPSLITSVKSDAGMLRPFTISYWCDLSETWLPYRGREASFDLALVGRTGSQQGYGRDEMRSDQALV